MPGLRVRRRAGPGRGAVAWGSAGAPGSERAHTRPCGDITLVHPGAGAKRGVSLVIAKRGLWSQKVSAHGRFMSLLSTPVLKTPHKRASGVSGRSALPASASLERGPGAAVWRWERQDGPLRSPRDSRNLDNFGLVFDNLSPTSERGALSQGGESLCVGARGGGAQPPPGPNVDSYS